MPVLKGWPGMPTWTIEVLIFQFSGQDVLLIRLGSSGEVPKQPSSISVISTTSASMQDLCARPSTVWKDITQPSSCSEVWGKGK